MLLTEFEDHSKLFSKIKTVMLLMEINKEKDFKNYLNKKEKY
jgi:hypothetical protein